MAHRVKRVAIGWEPVLTLAVDAVVQRGTVMELCEAFFALNPPTRLRLRDETLSGTLQALTSGQADLAIGVAINLNIDFKVELAAVTMPGRRLQTHALVTLRLACAAAPRHPLALLADLLSAAQLMAHRAVAVGRFRAGRPRRYRRPDGWLGRVHGA